MYYKELVNATDYANMYGLYDESGKAIGMIEQRLAGRDVGTYCYSLVGQYSKLDIRKLFKDAIKR